MRRHDKTKKIVCVIPARGGSKGIPKKNIISLKGKPLISYTIRASLESEVCETWVSTDSDEISDISMKFGARVLKRPAELAEDDSSTESVLIHFAENIDFDVIVLCSLLIFRRFFQQVRYS